MGEFKKGDFVRRTTGESLTTNAGRHGAGFVGQIADIVKGFTTDIVFTNGHAGLIENYEPWQPRVGERVRVARAELQHKSAAIGLEFTVIKEAYKVGNGVQTWGGDNAGGYVWRADELEPILAPATPEQPATIKIEEGKFYKTRDGRKVGPAFVSGNIATFGSRSNHASAVWSDDGRSSYRGDQTSLKDNDIVAEWIDAPEAKANPSNDNSQPKFKVGDRVKIVSNSRESYLDKSIGSFFTIKTKDGPNNTGWSGPSEENPYWWPAQDLELANITSPTAIAIVAPIENGQPKPSSTPHVHTSAGAAEKEAKRLAAKYKGKQFGVFTLTTTHEEAAPVYDHKWQNMAALGLKIDAIKELRAVAGLTLRGAKDAVEAWIEYENAA
ncbi:hypothetical protein [Agrobacterium tumefaciens]|uniref:hypothetical protein n=1 Tax=Agrobacterium tumefaciens TaxID=358 RepID=UPI000EF28864|nr:hypothetical protein [Agrobacterium tumefaciens]AYM05699.1 hypothetical protein At1D1460_14570 [Agrobacterium tumefaciens]NSZ32523.1 hypothetical protein [Agrobacterium tumefaciens]QLG22145.1 hypothetical protein EML4_07340 [Agrobacterium tumefaciens]UXS86035.1 hypothetical protein FY144_07310 [Agrobacterium tumefaciens]